MSEIQTELARPSEDPATRADAISYLNRTGNADLLMILGDDPVAMERSAAKARAMLNGHGTPAKRGAS